MRNSKTAVGILLVTYLLSLVEGQVNVPLTWSFPSEDTLQIDINNDAQNRCTGTFVGGAMRGVKSVGTNGGGHACGAKLVSDDKFQILIVDLTFNPGPGITGSLLGATGEETYGQSGTDTSNIITPNSFGAQFASVYKATTMTTIPATFEALPAAEEAVDKVMIVKIHNQVEKHWSQQLTSTGMTQWEMSGDLNQGYTRDLTIQFDQNASSATATATFTNGDYKFTITASYSGSTYDVKLNWDTLYTLNDHYLIPPSFSDEPNYTLGWRRGGTYNIGIFKPATATNTSQGQMTKANWLKKWMELIAVFINGSKIYNIIFPGTHDSGSTSFALKFLDFYFKTQTGGFQIAEQLEAGVRYFDLRVFEKDDASFKIMHNTQIVTISMTQLTVSAVLDSVNQFYVNNPNSKEIVILNFHRFLKHDLSTFNYAGLLSIISGHALTTANRIIPDSKNSMTYSQLIDDSGTARVIISWNHAGSKTANQWDGVDQNFVGDGVYLLNDFFNYIKSEHTAPQTSLSSASDGVNRPDTGPFHQHRFSTFLSDKSRTSYYNIIATDFIDKTIIIETGIAMNLIKVGAVAELDPEPSGAASLIVSLATTAILSLVLFF